MNEVFGDIWKEVGKADLILVTTNSYVNKRGELVMGRGAAREAALRYPELPRLLGEWVTATCGHLGDYGIVFVSKHILHSFSEMGAFQVKRHFKDDADPELIGRSADKLLQDVHRYGRVAMNYPGIGNGRLDIVQVEPVIRCLPDNVFVYRRLEGTPWTRKTRA